MTADHAKAVEGPQPGRFPELFSKNGIGETLSEQVVALSTPLQHSEHPKRNQCKALLRKTG